MHASLGESNSVMVSANAASIVLVARVCESIISVGKYDSWAVGPHGMVAIVGPVASDLIFRVCS